MDSQEYTEKALRTDLSDEQYRECEKRLLSAPGNVAMQMMMLLDRIIVTGQNADLLKRGVFYGKAEAIAHLGIGGSCSDEFMTSLEHGMGNPEVIRLFHAALGKVTEAAEFMETVREALAGGIIHKLNLAEENGDSLWYDALAGDSIQKISGLSLTDQMDMNIGKLRSRFPDKFDAQKALERDVDAEIVAMTDEVLTHRSEIAHPTDDDLRNGTAGNMPCVKCGQRSEGQSGEIPCSICGLPTVHDVALTTYKDEN